MDIGIQALLLFSLLGFFSGLLNAIAGGGGLLVLPVLLASGVPPINALATNKFQAVFGTLSSSFNFYRKGHIELKPLMPALSLCHCWQHHWNQPVTTVIARHFTATSPLAVNCRSPLHRFFAEDEQSGFTTNAQ